MLTIQCLIQTVTHRTRATCLRRTQGTTRDRENESHGAVPGENENEAEEESRNKKSVANGGRARTGDAHAFPNKVSTAPKDVPDVSSAPRAWMSSV